MNKTVFAFIALFAAFSLLAEVRSIEGELPAEEQPHSDILVQFDATQYLILFLQNRVSILNLPVDLLDQANLVIDVAQINLDTCKTNYQANAIKWQYKLCLVTHFKIANNAIDAIEIEATNRKTAQEQA